MVLPDIHSRGGSQTFDPMTANVVLTAHTKKLVIANPTGAGLNMRLPDARFYGLGMTILLLINIHGSNSLAIQDADGGAVHTLVAGHAVKLGLRANSTSAGTWLPMDSIVGVSAEPKPTLAFCFGGQSSGTIPQDRTPVSYDYLTEATTSRTAAAANLDRWGAYTISQITYKAGGGGTQPHYRYVIDTYTLLTGRSPTPADGMKPVLALLGKAWLMNGWTDIGEWALPDTWSLLAVHPTYNELSYNVAVNGYNGDEINILSGDDTGAEENAHVLYNRTLLTYSEAPRNPNVLAQHRGSPQREGSRYLGVVGGDHTGSAVYLGSDNLHFVYDMSLGLLGSWSNRLPFPEDSIEQAAHGSSPRNADVTILLGGTGYTGMGSDIWFWNDMLQSWNQAAASMATDKVDNAYHLCELSQP